MTTKTATERAAGLLAQPDKATHAHIIDVQAALQAQIADWHARLTDISADGQRIGIERRKVLESGTVEDAMKLEVESQQLRVWIERAQTQHDSLATLDTQVFARESLANLPKQYAMLTAKLRAVGELNATLLASWQELESLFGDTERMREAVKDSRAEVPAPDTELAKALEVAYRGVCPMPVPAAFTMHANIAEALGLRAAVVDTGGLRRVEVRAAA